MYKYLLTDRASFIIVECPWYDFSFTDDTKNWLFLQRDAMLAWVLAMAPCLSVTKSVFCQNRWTNQAGFWFVVFHTIFEVCWKLIAVEVECIQIFLTFFLLPSVLCS